MQIVKTGKIQKQGEFYFHCSECGCEWYADRTDKDLKISPPCVEFYVYMKCPNCKNTTFNK